MVDHRAVLAVSEEDIGAGARFQHVGEILARHHRRGVGIDIAHPRDGAGDIDGKVGLSVVVHGDRIAALIVDLDRALEGIGG